VRTALVAILAVIVGAGIAIGGFALGRDSVRAPTTSTTLSSGSNWSGEYAWTSNPDGTVYATDTVLITLLQTPGGIQGSWTETALATSHALALNGTETSMPPENSFSLTVARNGSDALSATVDNENTPSFEIVRTSSSTPPGQSGPPTVQAFNLEYVATGGGSEMLPFTSYHAQMEYQGEAMQIATECRNAPSTRGQV